MAKVDLGAVNNIMVVGGDLTSSSTTLGTLPSGDWYCIPVYPINQFIADIFVATDNANNVIVKSGTYRGACVVLCYNLVGGN